MRVFQNIGLYKAYVPRIEGLWSGVTSYEDLIRILIADRFGGVHYLKPVVEGDAACFFTAGDNDRLQQQWAKKVGMTGRPSLDEILLAQIEEHSTDIFYNLDPIRYGNAFLKRLPGTVKKTIAWRAAPSRGAQFLDHHLIVNNYPSLAEHYRSLGAKTAYFFPGHDPAMDNYAMNQDRPIDVLFIGGFSRHHLQRAAALEAVSQLSERYCVVFNLDVSLATKIAETPLGLVGPFRKLRRPANIRQVSKDPVFGLDMYRQISRAKVVINGRVDIAGIDRGNMRVWESLGCGAALVTDDGIYPRGMKPGTDFLTHNTASDILECINSLLSNERHRFEVSTSGRKMIQSNFSKEVQWKRFQELCE